MTASGDTLFSNAASWDYPDPDPLCEDARPERRTTAIGIAALGVLAVVAMTVDGRIRRRRRDEEDRNAASFPSADSLP